MIKILVPEDIPSANKGEAALFFGMKETLRALIPCEISLFSQNPAEDKRHYKEEAKIIDSRGITPAHIFDRRGTIVYKLWNYGVFIMKHAAFLLLYWLMGERATRIMKRDVWKSYMESDIILMSHDSFFALLYHGPLLFFFRKLNKVSAIYAATILPPDPKETSIVAGVRKWFAKYALSRASIITLREELSYEYVKLLLSTEKKIPPIEVYPDLAFLLKPDDEFDLKNKDLPEGRMLVGMAISQRKLEFAFPEMSSIDDRRELALDSIVNLVDYITRELDAIVVFVPHSIGPTKKLDDRVTAQWILERASQKEKIIIIRNEYNPMELKAMASCFDMTIGTRLHFTIDATSTYVPSMLITHKEDFRCHGIVGKMLGQGRYLYNIESIDHRTLITMAQELWSNRVATRKELGDRVSVLKHDTLKHGERLKEIYEDHKRHSV